MRIPCFNATEWYNFVRSIELEAFKLDGFWQAIRVLLPFIGDVAELADALDLGSSAHCGREGSNPSVPT